MASTPPFRKHSVCWELFQCGKSSKTVVPRRHQGLAGCWTLDHPSLCVCWRPSPREAAQDTRVQNKVPCVRAWGGGSHCAPFLPMCKHNCTSPVTPSCPLTPLETVPRRIMRRCPPPSVQNSGGHPDSRWGFDFLILRVLLAARVSGLLWGCCGQEACRSPVRQQGQGAERRVTICSTGAVGCINQ